MKTKQIFISSIFCSFFFFTNAQNVQSDNLAVSGGDGASGVSSGVGFNTFYGFKSGIEKSELNTFIGALSGYDSNNTSSDFFGYQSGINSVGKGNLFLGSNAGDGSQGSENILIGQNIGAGLIGSKNILIGPKTSEYNLNNNLIIDNDIEKNPLIWGDFIKNQLKFHGKVGVGYDFGNYPTTAGTVDVSKYNLFVKGGILTEEVRVSLKTTWADYVFNKNYKLATLSEVEKHIQQNGHLKNVPSAKEVAENGLEVGQIINIQQEKIEELTLYIIDQNKTNEKQSKEIEELKVLVKSLKEKN
ncbi:MAG: hypothetical protein KBC58_01680 [Flavobacterium sp.]|nr:hypothetical protein [Flavobacterium sp.]